MNKTPLSEDLDIGDEPIDQRAIERYNAENTSAIAIHSIEDIKRLSAMFIESDMFKSDGGGQVKQLAQACVKIVAGIEFGIQPFASMRGINIINGNAEMSSNLMAAKVKKHPKYDYRVVESSNEGCTLEFTEIVGGKPVSLGKSSWTVEDAKRAGLTRNPTWQKFPMNMCFARALSNGVRMFTPDVFYGAPVYVEGEITGEVEEKTTEPETTAPAAAQPAKADAVEGEVVTNATSEDAPESQEIDPLQVKLDEIAALAAELGHGPDWFVHVSQLIKTEADAEQVYSKLRTKQIDQMMNGDA